VILASSLATTMPASRHSEILMDARLAPSGIALDGSRSHEYAWSQIEIVSQSSQMLMILVDGVPKIMATTGKNEAVARAIIANCRVRENYVRDLMGEKFVEEARSAPSIERKKAMREELAKKSGSKFGKFMLWRDIVPQSAEYVGNGAPRKRSLLPAITLAFLKGKLIEKALLIGACIFTVVYVPLELYWRLAHAANVPATIVEEVLTGAVVVGILGGIPSIAASIRAEEARIDALLDKSRGGAGIEA
jgi:hypothetical protein